MAKSSSTARPYPNKSSTARCDNFWHTTLCEVYHLGVSHVQPREILGLVRLYLRASDSVVRRMILELLMLLAREAQSDHAAED